MDGSSARIAGSEAVAQAAPRLVITTSHSPRREAHGQMRWEARQGALRLGPVT